MKLLATQPALIALAVASALATQPVTANDESDKENKAQTQQNSAQQQDAELERIQVTGIRSAIKESLFLKQNATAVVDLVVADDIASFRMKTWPKHCNVFPG